MIIYHLPNELGVGVHLTRLRSVSLLPPCHRARRSASSTLLAASAPIVVRSSSRFAAGVKLPNVSDFLGVQVGGPIDPLRIFLLGVNPNNSALARRLFDALFESLCDSCSRTEGSFIRNGILEPTGSSERDSIRGVALSVPHVMSCLTAAGPSWSGVGDGRLGISEELSVVGDRGLSIEGSVRVALRC